MVYFSDSVVPLWVQEQQQQLRMQQQQAAAAAADAPVITTCPVQTSAGV